MPRYLTEARHPLDSPMTAYRDAPDALTAATAAARAFFRDLKPTYQTSGRDFYTGRSFDLYTAPIPGGPHRRLDIKVTLIA